MSIHMEKLVVHGHRAALVEDVVKERSEEVPDLGPHHAARAAQGSGVLPTQTPSVRVVVGEDTLWSEPHTLRIERQGLGPVYGWCRRTMGKLDESTTCSATCQATGHVAGEPSEVVSQGNSRTRRPMSESFTNHSEAPSASGCEIGPAAMPARRQRQT